MSGWVRLWHDMPTDPKWRSIARKSGQPLACVIALFNLLMVNAGNNDGERGRLSNWDNEDAASALDMEPEGVAAIISAMQGKVLDGDCLTGWEKRQPKREDGTAAQRKAAWQARRQNAKERNGTHGNAPEADAEPEADSENEDTGKPASSSAGPAEIDLIEAERRCGEAAGSDRLGPFAPIAEILLERKIDLDDALVVIRSRPARAGSVSSWKFYAKILRDKIAERAPATATFGPPKVHVMSGTPEWDAWVAHEGRARPLDAKGGWSFPSKFPPAKNRDAA